MRALKYFQRNTIALLALFVALGGTTYAATALPKNSVGTKQLKKNAVTNPKIKNGAVTGAKVADNSITGADVLESSLGKVASSASADQATTANTATNATNATNATHATNSDQLGGSPAATVQKRVTGTCPDVRAMAMIVPSGATNCAWGNNGITLTPLAGAGTNAFRALSLSSLFLVVSCHDSGLTQVGFYNNTAQAATLNWFYSDGTTVHASGSSLGDSNSNGHQSFDFGGARLEGQFILASDVGITTIKLHAFDGGTFCEVRGYTDFGPS
jgi:hypothetical protein